VQSEVFSPDRVRSLVHGTTYGVLCTQGGGQPYASLVAFAASEDLTHLVFATPRTTRKYALLEDCKQVAFLIDDRATKSEVMTISAVTATGRALELSSGEERGPWEDLFLGRHPHLREFVRSPTCALFRVRVARYLHVTRFQEVNEWRP
jgi:nitroimidazol reductase NimA-like FMN-containing flavoprotein (pyridoxamine 5'-phosphate oxidase superfamily)